MPAYALNEDAVRHTKRLIETRQYVLRSRWHKEIELAAHELLQRLDRERPPDDAAGPLI